MSYWFRGHAAAQLKFLVKYFEKLNEITILYSLWIRQTWIRIRNLKRALCERRIKEIWIGLCGANIQRMTWRAFHPLRKASWLAKNNPSADFHMLCFPRVPWLVNRPPIFLLNDKWWKGKGAGTDGRPERLAEVSIGISLYVRQSDPLELLFFQSNSQSRLEQLHALPPRHLKQWILVCVFPRCHLLRIIRQMPTEFFHCLETCLEPLCPNSSGEFATICSLLIPLFALASYVLVPVSFPILIHPGDGRGRPESPSTSERDRFCIQRSALKRDTIFYSFSLELAIHWTKKRFRACRRSKMRLETSLTQRGNGEAIWYFLEITTSIT